MRLFWRRLLSCLACPSLGALSAVLSLLLAPLLWVCPLSSPPCFLGLGQLSGARSSSRFGAVGCPFLVRPFGR